MSATAGESTTISPRRRLLEEVLEERSRVLAGKPPDEDDPPSGGWEWESGITRLAMRAWGTSDLEKRRSIAVQIAVVVLAWLEQFERELPAEPSAGRE